MPDTATQAPSHPDSFVCPNCGYSLFGIEHAARCPECGLEIDRSLAGESQLPWSQRLRIGRLAAFWRTMRAVMLRPRKIMQEMNRPVSYEDARRFRHLCVAMAALPFSIVAVIHLANAGLEISILQYVVAAPVMAFSIWLYFFAVTGIPSLFLTPKDAPVLRQNRAVALSYYAAAPLAMAWLPAVCSIIPYLLDIAWPDWDRSEVRFDTVVLIYTITAVGWILVSIGRPILFVLFCGHCRALRRIVAGPVIVCAWLGLFYLILVGIPAVVLLITIGIKSLM